MKLRELTLSKLRHFNQNALICLRLKEILDYCASTYNYVFYELDYLNDFSKLGYNSDLEEEDEEEEEI